MGIWCAIGCGGWHGVRDDVEVVRIVRVVFVDGAVGVCEFGVDVGIGVIVVHEDDGVLVGLLVVFVG